MDYYLANSNFNDVNFANGRLTSAQLEEAEYLANADIENEMKRLKVEEAESQVADQLRGLGYIE